MLQTEAWQKFFRCQVKQSRYLFWWCGCVFSRGTLKILTHGWFRKEPIEFKALKITCSFPSCDSRPAGLKKKHADLRRRWEIWCTISSMVQADKVEDDFCQQRRLVLLFPLQDMLLEVFFRHRDGVNLWDLEDEPWPNQISTSWAW